MLSAKIDTTRQALSELASEVTPQQWGLIRACVQDLGVISRQVQQIEAVLLPPQRQHQPEGGAYGNH